MAQSKGMSKLMHRRSHQVRAVTVLLVNQPRLLVVKVRIAADALARVEGVCQHSTGPLERVSIAMVAPEIKWPCE